MVSRELGASHRLYENRKPEHFINPLYYGAAMKSKNADVT
jgi:hypothetical protein